MSPPNDARVQELDHQIRRAALEGAEERVVDRKQFALALEGELPADGQPTSRLLVILSSLLLASTTIALLSLRVSVDPSAAGGAGTFVRGELAGVAQDIELYRSDHEALPASLADLDYTPEELEVIHYEILGLKEFRVTYRGDGVRLSTESGDELAMPAATEGDVP